MTLNTGKIYQLLDFSNKWNIDEAVKSTAMWYIAQLKGENMKAVTDKIINSYFDRR